MWEYLKSLGLTIIAVMALSVPCAADETPPSFIRSWGSFGSGPGQFDEANGLGIDSAGNIYVADSNNHRIQEFTADGHFIRAWQGSGISALNYPVDVAVDPTGNIYVADYLNQRIVVFDQSLVFVRRWSVMSNSAGPFAIAIDPTGQTVYAAAGDHLFSFTTTGTIKATWQYAHSPGVGIAVGNSAMLYAAITYDNIVRLYNSSGAPVTQWGVAGSGPGQLALPGATAVDMNENVYVGQDDDRVEKFTSSGSFLVQWGTHGTANGQFEQIRDIVLDDTATHIYVLDYVGDQNTYRVQEFGDASTGALRSTWGRLMRRYR